MSLVSRRTFLGAAGLATVAVFGPQSLTVAQAAPVDTVVDDAVTSGAARWTYTGSWLSGSGLPTTNWEAGTEHYVNATSSGTAKAVLTFTGQRARVYGIAEARHGIYAFSVDGGAETTVDAYAATRTFRRQLFDTGTLAPGAHTVTMRITGRKNIRATAAAGHLDYAVITAEQAAPVTTWRALPAPTTLAVSAGSWQVVGGSRIVSATSTWAEVSAEAARLSAEIGTLRNSPGPQQVTTANPSDLATASDIVLAIGDTGSTNKESYRIAVSATGVSVTGASAAGLFYGTRQILHNLRAQQKVPYAVATGVPVVAERSLHIDMARKFYTTAWLKQLVRNQADVGINTIELHFSEREGFRIASTVAGVSSAQAQSKAEIREIVDLAHSLHVQVIPSLDLPGHLTKALTNYPQYRLSSVNGPVPDALDITNPAAVAWATALVDEFAEVFHDSTYWNLGADEFVDFSRMQNYPSLTSYARTRYNNSSANGFDALTGFANDLAAHLQGKGFTVRVWNDGMWRGAVSSLSPQIQVCWWTNWSSGMKPVSTAISKGHTIINFNDSVMYYVLGQAAGYTYPTAEKFWTRNWHPGVFPGLPGGGTQTWARPYPSWLGGASFAIWSDVATAQTEAQVTTGIRGPSRAMAERSWNGGSSMTLAEFNAASTGIGDGAPAPTQPSGPVVAG